MRELDRGRTLTCAMLLLSLIGAAPPPAAPAIDGFRCDRMEGNAFHIHQHVAILDHGSPVPIPSDVGRPASAECLYWIHTHTADGIVHIESPAVRTFTLGNFFDVWGQPLSRRQVGPISVPPGALKIFVDGSAYTGDPRAIEMTQHADIVIEIGPPYTPPKPFTAWGGQ